MFKKYSFVKNVKYCLMISLLIIALGVVMMCVKGVNWGIDFTGGTLLNVDMGSSFDTADVEQVLKDLNIADAPVSKSEDSMAVIRIRSSAGGEITALTEQLTGALKDQYPDVRIDSMEDVGGVMGKELRTNALLAILIACALILVYISFRFEVYSALIAVLALCHDALIMFSFVVIFQVQINSSFVAAVLTIVGYSINATIVVFDRLRENTRKYPNGPYTRGELVDISVRETMTRSINTTLTTFIMIFLVYLLGVDSVREFTMPIIVGLLSGTFSSVCLASPCWWLISGRDKEKKFALRRVKKVKRRA